MTRLFIAALISSVCMLHSQLADAQEGTTHVVAVTADSTGNDTTSIRDNRVFTYFVLKKGQSITINTDSLFIMNRATWHYYNDKTQAFLEYKSISGKLSSTQGELINSYQDLVNKQDKTYDTLLSLYSLMSKKSFDFSTAAQNDIGQIQSKLDSTQNYLTAARADIKSALDEVKLAKKDMRRKTIGWAIGGFGIGVSASAIVYLLVHH